MVVVSRNLKHKGAEMKVCLLTMLAVLLLCTGAWAQDDAVEVDADVVVDTDLRDGVVVGEVDQVDANVDLDGDSDADLLYREEPRRGSLRDEYRQWSRTSSESRRLARADVDPDSVDDFDSVDDVESAPRNVEEWFRDDVVGNDRDSYRDDYVESRSGSRYSDYPEYDNDAVAADRVGDRMYDDYDRRGGDRYWSRTYGDVRYWDNRGHGTGCGCGGAKCGSGKCGAKGKCGKCGTKSKCGCHKPAVKSCGKCGVKASKCGCHKPAVKSCGKCGVKASKCGCHKPAVKSCGKCKTKSCNKCGDKCGGKCGAKAKSSCKCGKVKKCSKC